MRLFNRLSTVMMYLALGATVQAQGPFTLAGGMVAIEAEDFAVNLSPRSDHEWVFTNATAGYSGDGYMQGLPDDNFVFSDWATTSPELQYAIVFNHATTHYVWVRGYSHDTSSDSVHWGLNGVTNAGQGINWISQNEWVWTNRVTAGTVATINITATGTNIFSLWMREDGARIDRIVITTNAGFRPRKGNAWHIPHQVGEPTGQYAMRTPYLAIFTNTAVTLFSGNQFQGGGNAGDQVQTGSMIYYKAATGTVWQSVPMLFHSTTGNNKYYSGVIPPGQFAPGDVVQYYLRIPYSDFLPTFLYSVDGAHQTTEDESVARASPYTFTVRATPEAGFPSPADWRDVNIYQIFTDRFNDGDPSNNTAHPGADYEPATGNRIHGGDFKGIEQKLDYIQALGANAIWIKPIHLNAGQGAYHGYHAQDFYELAPNLGTIDDLKSMVAAAHARGIYVILDIVVNHQGRRIDSGDANFPDYNGGGYNLRWTTGDEYPPPFNQLSHFHNFGHIQNWSDAQQLVLGEMNGLDDLKTETRHVRTNMVQIFSFWTELADLDGFRIDTVKHVEMGFWQFFNNEMRALASAMGKTNFIQFGEAFETSESANGLFTGTQAGGAYANDTVLNFPLYDKMISVFATASGNTKLIEDHYSAITNNYHIDAHMRLINFLDNHDVRRFMHSSRANNNTNRLAVALAFLYTSRGIPNLYYGTEQNFNGGDDPSNREDMFDGEYEQGPSLSDNFDMTKGSFLHVARLNNFRRLYPQLRTGDHVNRWNNPSGAGLFSYARRQDGAEILTVLNTAGSTQTLTNRNTIHAPGTVMVNLFNTNETITVTAATNTPPIEVPGTSYKMFVAQSLWQPLDPVVRQQAPAHGATDIPVTNPVVLHFSKSMDTNLTEAAFVIDPPALGTFSWSADRTALTFTPSGPTRLADSTRYTVRVEADAVDAETGNAFYAPFETFFVTGVAPDTDGDGLPDWWESEHFGGPTNAHAAALASNEWNTLLETYIAGLDPLSTDSYWRIMFTGDEELELPSVPGRLYRVEAHSVTDEVWNVVISNRPGTGAPLTFSVTNDASSLWYRGRVNLP